MLAEIGSLTDEETDKWLAQIAETDGKLDSEFGWVKFLGDFDAELANRIKADIATADQARRRLQDGGEDVDLITMVESINALYKLGVRETAFFQGPGQAPISIDLVQLESQIYYLNQHSDNPGWVRSHMGEVTDTFALRDRVYRIVRSNWNGGQRAWDWTVTNIGRLFPKRK